LSSDYNMDVERLESRRRQKDKTMNGADAKVLPIRPAVGLAVVSLIAWILAVLTARECHRNLELNHIAPFAPSLLYGCVTWFWWVAVTVALWTRAQRWPAILKPSKRTIMAHLGGACILAIIHLLLQQHTIWFASRHWPIWGHVYANLHVINPERFGIDVVIYGFICGICAFLYSRMQTQHALVQKLEIERQLTQAQLKALQMQMEPHFLFNTLNAITSLMVQGRNKEAIKTMTHLNTILRTTLRRKSPEKVPFVEELRIVESYLAIQQVRFAGRLEVKIEVTPEALDGLVPCFVLQPLVENAIQHGIAPSEAGGFIETRVKRLGDMLWMEVKDNGRGPNGSDTKGHGIGLQNIRERLTYFYPDAYAFKAVAPPGGGYEVTVQIPYERAV
jgi:signal transduction histidine kinase